MKNKTNKNKKSLSLYEKRRQNRRSTMIKSKARILKGAMRKAFPNIINSVIYGYYLGFAMKRIVRQLKERESI